MSVPFTGLDAELFEDCGLADALYVDLTVKGEVEEDEKLKISDDKANMHGESSTIDSMPLAKVGDELLNKVDEDKTLDAIVIEAEPNENAENHITADGVSPKQW